MLTSLNLVDQNAELTKRNGLSAEKTLTAILLYVFRVPGS
jgi:hypothetical protein